MTKSDPYAILKTWLAKHLLDIVTNEGNDNLEKTYSICNRDALELYCLSSSTKDLSPQMSEDAVNFSLAHLIDAHARCFFMQTSYAVKLFLIGLGQMKVNFEGDKEQREIRAALTDIDVRWIITPCNNGMFAEVGEASNKHHWGLLIIDKNKNTARWLDGHLTVEERPGGEEDRIVRMYDAGRAAGKVLRGVDRILGQPEKTFNACTLKYVPHDKTNNACKEDRGACGPYMFAILDFLLNQDKSRVLGRLDNTFRKTKKATRAGNLAFNSKATRDYIITRIRNEWAPRHKGENFWQENDERELAKAIGMSEDDLLDSTSFARSIQSFLEKRGKSNGTTTTQTHPNKDDDAEDLTALWEKDVQLGTCEPDMTFEEWTVWRATQASLLKDTQTQPGVEPSTTEVQPTVPPPKVGDKRGPPPGLDVPDPKRPKTTHTTAGKPNTPNLSTIAVIQQTTVIDSTNTHTGTQPSDTQVAPTTQATQTPGDATENEGTAEP